MLRALCDCLGWRRKRPPPVISWPAERDRPPSLQSPRAAPMRPNVLPALPNSSSWSLPDVMARPSTPIVAPKTQVPEAWLYGQGRMREAMAMHVEVDVPDSVEEEALPRLSYEQKGKWPAHRPPTPKSVELPAISLDGHAFEGDSGSDDSDVSQRSIFFAP